MNSLESLQELLIEIKNLSLAAMRDPDRKAEDGMIPLGRIDGDRGLVQMYGFMQSLEHHIRHCLKDIAMGRHIEDRKKNQEQWEIKLAMTQDLFRIMVLDYSRKAPMPPGKVIVCRGWEAVLIPQFNVSIEHHQIVMDKATPPPQPAFTGTSSLN